MTQSIPRKPPELPAETLPDAKTIDGVWTQLNRTVRQAVAKVVPRKGRHAAPDGGVDRLDHMSARRRGDPSHSMQVARVAPDWPVAILMHGGRVVGDRITYVGLDVHKDGIAVALAEGS